MDLYNSRYLLNGVWTPMTPMGRQPPLPSPYECQGASMLDKSITQGLPGSYSEAPRSPYMHVRWLHPSNQGRLEGITICRSTCPVSGIIDLILSLHTSTRTISSEEFANGSLFPQKIKLSNKNGFTTIASTPQTPSVQTMAYHGGNWKKSFRLPSIHAARS